MADTEKVLGRADEGDVVEGMVVRQWIRGNLVEDGINARWPQGVGANEHETMI